VRRPQKAKSGSESSMSDSADESKTAESRKRPRPNDAETQDPRASKRQKSSPAAAPHSAGKEAKSDGPASGATGKPKPIKKGFETPSKNAEWATGKLYQKNPNLSVRLSELFKNVADFCNELAGTVGSDLD
jgi:hypothetical protein